MNEKQWLLVSRNADSKGFQQLAITTNFEFGSRFGSRLEIL
ncbi:hypothetical protein lacNasYZ03_09240 [Lactobacillus nasalidis]|uniref:Uncharacterized protein n=1 Tax=Lactobacillus nasalidis TaxID=2797258 RepID=A0ABQ3WAK8_9LACO|nr:hypothetical protein lacNasYZ01_17130 [Lactobacillus nasalidis]GHV99962.1 hypothetical protein lacNasYZ02_13920 [Lactobacillus nasalidis]GHW00539.1 hypothetical protein lacNasYZ03_02260 [Lactobacillus nasalidis]GHW01237.1 hypothetical protein lacNasYZ03_09240 [Lactobacillus nasalidis]